MSTLPITLLGGYLGAGKTTLINRVLADRSTQRLAVLVNDFGAVNVDAGLIDRADGRVLELANGCVCCSMSDDLVNTLLDITERRPIPDALLVETSGVAEPARVRGALAMVPGVSVTRTLVAAHVGRIRRLAGDPQVGPLIRAQLAAAEALVLTHADVTTTALARSTRAWLADALPDVGRFEVACNEPLPDGLIGGDAAQGCAGPAVARPSGTASSLSVGADAGGLFTAVTARLVDPLSEARLKMLMTTRWPGLERAKGTVRIGDTRREPRLVQFANGLWTCTPVARDDPAVFQLIGRRGAFDPVPMLKLLGVDHQGDTG